MTQKYLRKITILSFVTFTCSVLGFQTFLCLCLSIISSFYYFRYLKDRCMSKGILQIFPESIQVKLLKKSLFDIICQFWFEQSFKLLKLLFKPLLEHVDRQNPEITLREIDYETRQKYLKKGVVKMFPKLCQQIILGHERMIKMNEQQQRLILKQNISQRNTQDMSDQQYPKLRMITSLKQIIRQNNQQEKQIICRYDRQIKPVKQKQVKKQNILQIIRKSIQMAKKIVQFQNVNGHITRLSTKKILAWMLFFWIVLLVQIKFNRKARLMLFKIIYVIGWIFTVFGATGTTSILCYKGYQKIKQRKSKELQQ